MIKNSITIRALFILWVFIFTLTSSDAKNPDSYRGLNDNSNTGKDYTFCYGSISVTLFDGGMAVMNRYSIDGVLIKSLWGEYTIYGRPTDMPGQTVRIKYEGSDELFRYDLIRDGFGNPSVLIDGRGRNYKLCNTSNSSQSSYFKEKAAEITKEEEARLLQEYKENLAYIEANPVGPMDEFIGYYLSTDGNLEMEIRPIPFKYSAGQDIEWSPSETKMLLTIKITKRGLMYCKGELNYKTKSWAYLETVVGFNYSNLAYRIMPRGKWMQVSQENYDLGFFDKIDESEYIKQINKYRLDEYGEDKNRYPNYVEDIDEAPDPRPQTIASFPGGKETYQKYLKENVKYPNLPREKRYEGEVYIKYCITKEGLISQLSLDKISSTLSDIEFISEAARVVKSFPKMHSATDRNGQPVNSWNLAIINFSPEEDEISYIYFQDSRDLKSYKSVQIGNQTWMAQNLSFKTDSECFAYGNDASNANVYGYLYNWEVAKNVCPSGWHLPLQEEWEILSAYAGGDKLAGRILIEKGAEHWWGDIATIDLYGFHALPGGQYRIKLKNSFTGELYKDFTDLETGAFWWSSDAYDNDVAIARMISYDGEGFEEVIGTKTNGYSVRCIKNDGLHKNEFELIEKYKLLRDEYDRSIIYYESELKLFNQRKKSDFSIDANTGNYIGEGILSKLKHVSNAYQLLFRSYLKSVAACENERSNLISEYKGISIELKNENPIKYEKGGKESYREYIQPKISLLEIELNSIKCKNYLLQEFENTNTRLNELINSSEQKKLNKSLKGVTDVKEINTIINR